MFFNQKIFLSAAVCFTSLNVFNFSSANEQPQTIISFSSAIKQAQINDPWLTGNKHQEQAIRSLSKMASSMPDPVVSLGLANIATDSFSFNQDPMSQFKVGIAQQFPRGDSLNLQSEKFKLSGEQFPLQRADRKAKVTVIVGQLWLQIYQLEQSVKLIKQNRLLFEQLVSVVQASYSSGNGKTRQQDIVQAELELTRLDDKLEQLIQQKNYYTGQLSQWLLLGADKENYSDTNNSITTDNNGSVFTDFKRISVTDKLVDIELVLPNSTNKQSVQSLNYLHRYLVKHPSILAIEKKILASKTSIKLAEQKFKPQWGVSASYGYRADDAMSAERSDLFSLGVNFDLPLFTGNKQDQALSSAVSATEAIKTEKLLQLRKLYAAYLSDHGRLKPLEQRILRYQNIYLPQLSDQIETILSAYSYGDGSLSDVVRARIDKLNADIDFIALKVEKQKYHLSLNYLFTSFVSQGVTHE